MLVRTFPKEMIEEFIQHLALKYPATFFLEPQLKRPLKKNILIDLEHDHVLDAERREAALNFYMRDWNYEAVLQAGMKRIDLNGKPAGTVTELEEREAQERVRAQKRELREKRRQDPIEVVRKLHDNGKISTDALSKISAPSMRPPMAKARAPIPEPPQPANGADLATLRSMWSNIDTVLSTTEDPTLRSALAAAALKVFAGEIAKTIATLEGESR